MPKSQDSYSSDPNNYYNNDWNYRGGQVLDANGNPINTTQPTGNNPAPGPGSTSPTSSTASSTTAAGSDSTPQSTREQVRDAWISQGAGKTTQDLQNFIKQYSYYNPQLSGPDKVTWDFGNGKVETLDMIGDVGGKGMARWGGDAGLLGADPNAGAAGTGSAGASAGVGGGLPGGGGAGGGAGYGNDAIRQALIDQLLSRSQQSLAVDMNDPTMRAQIAPYDAAQARAARQQIAAAAEAGGPLQNLASATRLANETAAQNTGAFGSGLIGKEIDSRRQEIQAALSGMQGYLSDQDRNALEKELGYLNAATQRYGIDTSAATSRYSTDVNANTAMRGQDMSNDQYYAGLGLTSADRAAYWDAVRSGLIGG